MVGAYLKRISDAMRIQAAPDKTGSLAGKLGCPPDGKLLIVHADDLGITHSVNAATIRAFETGLVNSGSMMAPCPWFPEIADYARSHTDADLGLHLTLTSERASCRWGPVSSKDKVRSLVDQDGYFHRDWEKTRVKVREVAVELRAQIEKALAMGVQPTHLDSHQLILYSSGEDLFEMVVQLGREYGLPVSVSRDWFSKWPYITHHSFGPNVIAVDYESEVRPDVTPDQWPGFYTDVVKNLRPGITELLIHLGYDDEELRAFSSDRESWGSAWRQRDFDFFTCSTFRELLRQYGIALVTWRDLGRVAFCEGKWLE